MIEDTSTFKHTITPNITKKSFFSLSLLWKRLLEEKGHMKAKDILLIVAIIGAGLAIYGGVFATSNGGEPIELDIGVIGAGAAIPSVILWLVVTFATFKKGLEELEKKVTAGFKDVKEDTKEIKVAINKNQALIIDHIKQKRH